MGVYTRKDSPYFWLYLEQPEAKGVKDRTTIRCDATTAWQRKQNRQLAEQLYHLRMTEYARGDLEDAPELELPTITFSAFAEWFRVNKLPLRRGREREAEILPRLIRDFGELPLTEITQARVSEWMTTRLNTPTVIMPKKHTKARMVCASPTTVNREVDLLKSILQAAVPEYLSASPLFGMKRLPTKTPKKRLLTQDEERRLLAVMTPADRALFLLGLDGLVRMGDILDARRSDRAGDTLWIAQTKSGDGFSVPLSARVQRALDALRGDSEYYFELRRRPAMDKARRAGVKTMLQRACAAAKVPYGRVNGLTFHWATRRTGATRMLTHGVDIGTVQKVGRWKRPDVVLGIYHELIDAKARAAVEVPGRRSRSVPAPRKITKKSKKSE